MSAPLQRLHYHVGEDPDLPPDARAASPEDFPVAAANVAAAPDAGTAEDAPARTFTSNEAAARFYLDQLLQRDDRPAMRALLAPDRPEYVPGLAIDGEQDLRPLRTHQVRFTQTHRDIPVFGARAVVELTAARELVSVTAQLDEVTGVDPVESLSRTEALQRVAAYTGADLPPEVATTGRLNYYKDDETGSWHLTWLFIDVPAAPPGDTDPDAPDARLGHGFGPRPVPARYNYLVDAHDGEVLFAYSAVRTAMPTPARYNGNRRERRAASHDHAFPPASPRPEKTLRK